MKYLLDTHTILWFFDHVEKLPETVLKAIIDPVNRKCVSIVSAWKLAIKISLGKLTFEGGVSEFFNMIDENGFELLPVKAEYVNQVEALPFLHRDPFDRLLVASAMSEKMTLITADVNIQRYDVAWVW